jgi:CPA2 family monovalent cation:H+ antiporter-2
VCFAFSLLAKRAGYSIALGAFLAGTLVAEAGHARILEPMVRPVRDIFAAVFFVAVGMMIDPRSVWANLPLAALLVAVIVLGKIGAVSLGGVLSGRGLTDSVRSAIWLLPLGEFGFLVAEVARNGAPRGGEVHSIAAAMCVITLLAQPLWLRSSDRIAVAIEHRVSRRSSVFATLQATWMDALRRARPGTRRGPLTRALLWLGVDSASIVAVIIGVSLWAQKLERWAIEALGLETIVARGALIAITALCCAPFGFGILRGSRRFAVELAERALPRVDARRADMAVTPRRTLSAALQLATLLGFGVPIVAAIQPFVPTAIGLATGLLFAAGGAVAVLHSLRKRVADLDGHFRAGSQMVLETLVRQGRGNVDLDAVSQVLPGLGHLTSVRVSSRSSAAGVALDKLDLHARTGATVVCVTRGSEGWTSPSGERVLAAGDVVAVTGTQDQVARVERLLGPARVA